LSYLPLQKYLWQWRSIGKNIRYHHKCGKKYFNLSERIKVYDSKGGTGNMRQWKKSVFPRVNICLLIQYIYTLYTIKLLKYHQKKSHVNSNNTCIDPYHNTHINTLNIINIFITGLYIIWTVVAWKHFGSLQEFRKYLPPRAATDVHTRAHTYLYIYSKRKHCGKTKMALFQLTWSPVNCTS